MGKEFKQIGEIRFKSSVNKKFIPYLERFFVYISDPIFEYE